MNRTAPGTELQDETPLTEVGALSTTTDPGWSSLSFRILCEFARKLRFGRLTFITPAGARLVFEGEEASVGDAIIIVRDFAFARRTLLGGDIGFFEAWADGQWQTPDLAECLFVLARNADQIADAIAGLPLTGVFEQIRHFANKNTRAGSKRNISAHYDLGNAFYEKWLDETMTYSSALFASDAEPLHEAQINKYRSLARFIDLKPGETVLEIGSGWGGFAEYAAKECGADVTGLTLSREQFDYASARIFRQGLAEKVRFKLVDYRDAEGAYDKIASIEMFEAVGREYWPTYFGKIHQRLKPGGVAGLQVITIADHMFKHYLGSVDFIQRYVFPGGVLPSPTALRAAATEAGLSIRDTSAFGLDYARTLRQWRERFSTAWADIAPLGFDERFRKLWKFYLAYCEAGFRAQSTDVCQITLAKS